MVDFFVCEKIILKERMVSVMKIIKEEIQFEESLKQRLEFICEFSKVSPTFIKGSIRKIEKTNLSYIEPHKVIVKNITLLVFNYSNDVYISNLSKKIKLSELEEYLKKYKNVKKVINIIKDMNIKDKLRLGICLTISDWANILYNRNEIYKKFDIMLKEVDEEYGTTLINFAKYKLVMFAMAKLMEMETTEQNKVELYLFNLI